MNVKEIIKFLRKSTDGNVRIIEVESLSQIADFIEQQEKYAELGRLALKTPICHAEYGVYTDDECKRDCPQQDFCKLRAELNPSNSRELEGAEPVE